MSRNLDMHSEWDMDSPEGWKTLSEENQNLAIAWVRSNVKQARYRIMGSRELRSLLALTGLYITNGQMKGAMAACGYQPAKGKDRVDWLYRVRIRADS